MRKFLVRAIPITTLILFILVMQTDIIYKNYFDKYNISESINLILQNIKDDKWLEADANVKQLSKYWDKVVRIIQFSAEKNEIQSLDKNLSRIQGAIMATDKTNALIELNEALEHWDNISE